MALLVRTGVIFCLKTCFFLLKIISLEFIEHFCSMD